MTYSGGSTLPSSPIWYIGVAGLSVASTRPSPQPAPSPSQPSPTVTVPLPLPGGGTRLSPPFPPSSAPPFLFPGNFPLVRASWRMPHPACFCQLVLSWTQHSCCLQIAHCGGMVFVSWHHFFAIQGFQFGRFFFLSAQHTFFPSQKKHASCGITSQFLTHMFRG